MKNGAKERVLEDILHSSFVFSASEKNFKNEKL